MVLGPSRQNQTADKVSSLRAFDDAERVRLALASAGVLSFSWTLADDRILWDGPVEILPDQYGADSIAKGKTLLASIGAESRAKLAAVVATRSRAPTQFQIEVEIASALGSVWFSMLGARIPDASGATERLTGLMREMTERRREQQRLTYLATRDELTGQLNRNSLRAELAEAIDRAKAEERSCAFLVASIDRLAMINDAYGFDAADEVIVAVGERIARSLRGSDIIGRIAGNKLGVILANCTEREISLVAERLRAIVRDQVVETRAGMVSATISAGAVWLPSGAASSQEAMLRAEETLNRARSSGRDGFALYNRSPQLETARLRLMAIADEVVTALKEDRLTFAYQPIIEAKTKKPVHYECLLRMVKPDGTIASAGQFVPAAEQLGLVRLVDRHALELTVSQLHAHPDVTLAVNVSGTTAGDPSWLQSFIRYVESNSAVADRMIVELTETAALHHFEENARFVSQLREMGCRVAIDDFGAGYTSFRNLQMLKVDTVKIDGAYVRGLSESPENQVFVRTLVDLAKNFNLKTVAEWVSSDEDAALLEGFGVDYFQGFHFGEPQLKPSWMA
ncbi:MAG TPA: bifunctional diguanylate cyclase/phosphodiesterase [Rhizomicrobium sp.]|nr:bifunctional diguanylate cyclase/phosphodiesterase [Rhizomicrobium sp.]